MATATTFLVESNLDSVATQGSMIYPSQSETHPSSGDKNSHEHDDDPEDILFDSLQTLYDYQPVTFTYAGASYTYTHIEKSTASIKIRLQTPDPDATNWSLHASSIWIASMQLARGVGFLHMDHQLRRIRSVNEDKNNAKRSLRLLELGASAGLPSILIAKLYPAVSVVATDYPDPQVMHTLAQNIESNGAEHNCCAIPYRWGTDPKPLFFSNNSHGPTGFDIVIAADTLWNSCSHFIFVDSLRQTLHRAQESRVHLVSGLHTGRYVIDSFLHTVVEAGFCVLEVLEREVVTEVISGIAEARTRAWDVTRSEYEEERDRRGWVVWIELCWEASQLS